MLNSNTSVRVNQAFDRPFVLNNGSIYVMLNSSNSVRRGLDSPFVVNNSFYQSLISFNNTSVLLTLNQSDTEKTNTNTVYSVVEEESSEESVALHESSLESCCNKPVTFLLIMVSVQPEEFSARQCIRNTWYHGFNDSEVVMMRFAIGTKGVVNPSVSQHLQNESDTYGDIAFLENITDHWITSTNKTLAMFIWAHENINFTYLMKAEYNTFVYVKNMIEELEKRPMHTRLYYGRIQFKKRPIRRGEFADPKWDLAKYYLPFALGGGYILSSDLITLLVQRRHHLAYHYNEDTAVASWICAYRYERRSDNLICVSPFGNSKTLEGNCESRIIAQICNGLTGKDMQKWFKIIYETTVIN